ncbi:hypothetical protein IWZ00DRAFT_551320, partial [Phyllosticta capitalensis]
MDTSEDEEKEKVQRGVVPNFHISERRPMSLQERADSRTRFLDMLVQALEGYPRRTSDCKEWLGATLEEILENQPELARSFGDLFTKLPQQISGNSHELTLSSHHPLEVVDVARVSHGPRIGYNVLSIQSHYSFPMFLDLARELRDRIYGFAITGDSSINFDYLCCRTTSHFECGTLTPGLLTVSKQVYEESVPVLWSNNTFAIPGWTITQFLDRYGDKASRHLRCIHLKVFEDVETQEVIEYCDDLFSPSLYIDEYIDVHLDRLARLNHLHLEFYKCTFEFCYFRTELPWVE